MRTKNKDYCGHMGNIAAIVEIKRQERRPMNGWNDRSPTFEKHDIIT